MAVRLDVFAQRTGVRVALVTTGHAARVGLLFLMRANVLEAITRVRVRLIASFEGTQIWPLTCTNNNETRELFANMRMVYENGNHD